MSADHQVPSLSKGIVTVSELSIAGGNLTWIRAGASEQAPRDELLLVLGAANRGSPPASDFFLVFLKEESENRDSTFRLSVLGTTEIPDELHQHVINGVPPYLRHGNTNEVDIIVSTKSGLGLAPRVWQDVLQPLWDFIASHEGRAASDLKDGATKSHYRVTVTESAETIRDFAKNLWAPASRWLKSRTVVLLSGDGGVVDLLNGTDGEKSAEKPPMMALLPLGTGNALFHSTHKPLYSHPGGPSPLVHGLRTLFQGVSCDLPVFRASFSPGSRIVTFADKSSGSSASAEVQRKETFVSHLQGAVVASYGFHASIVYESDTPEHRVHGDKRFRMVAEELLRESHPYAAKVSIRRRGSSATFEDIPRDTHAYVLTTPLSNLERKFTISPASKPLEGQLRLVHFGPIGGERTMNVMMKAYEEGSHIGMQWPDGERVGYDEVDEVRVKILEDDERWRKVCIDGTTVEVPKGGEMSIKMFDYSLAQVLVNPTVLEGYKPRLS
ncbi:hypothetical protein ACJ41O_007980 [Fusarium nematophilum]